MVLLLALTAHAADWPLWGVDATRNMVSTEKAVVAFEPGKLVAGTEDVDDATAKGLRWVQKLGSQTYGNPTVADGRVLVGTNNQATRRPGLAGDYSVTLAFAEGDGALLWQHTVPKLGSGKVNDWEFLGICSSPQIVGDAAYVVTTRGDVVALDVHGLANGNQGTTDEAVEMVAPGLPAPELDPAIDADVLWRYDVPTELGVFPHNTSSNSALVLGDRLYVGTSNGTDWSHLDLPAPFAPTLIALDRHTGKLVAEEAVGIGERTFHANWASPGWAPTADGGRLLFGAGDGFLYGFGVDPVDDEGLAVLPERWRVDGNLPSYRAKDGTPIRYATPEGPSEFIGTPVYAEGLVYAAIGQDPEHGPGVGRLVAVDPADGGLRWSYEGISRTISTVAVHKGIVYAVDYDGRLHALDARTGRVWWVHETRAHVWGSPYVVGKVVYLGNEDGILTLLAAGKKKKVLREVTFPAPIYSTPVQANGTLYVATQTHLYAFDGK